MLQGDFFSISSIEITGFAVKATLVINVGHTIFGGHFPDQPVVPGVCMMQMIKEILEQVLEKKTNLVKASEMKFLTIINPQETTSIKASVHYSFAEDGTITIAASLFNEGLTYFKFKGAFLGA